MRYRFGKTMGRLVLASAAAACLILPDLASAQADGAVAFDIAPQELDAALTRLADQAGLHLLFPSRDLAGRRSAGLSGRYSPAEALTRLLAGSGYSWRFGPDNSIVLEKAPEQGGAMTLSPVQVEGQSGTESPVGPGLGYVARQSATAAKTDTPLAEIPQSVSVVTRQQMDDQDVQNVAQALRYTPGVLPELRGSWTRYDQFSSRGFELDSNEFLDGLRLLPGYQATPQVDSYFLDRIEVLKGPASVLYGSMAPGGMLNMISKRPTSDPYHEVGLQTGSHGDVEGTVDLGGPLDDNGDLLYRFTALGRDGGAQVDHEKNQRVAVAPALTWKPDANDTLTVLASFQSDPKGGFYDFLPYQGSVVAANGVKIPTSFYTGDLDYSTFRRSQYSLTYLYEHRFDETWTVRQTLRVMHVDAADFLLQGEGWDTVGSTLARYAWSDRENVNNLAFDNQAQAKFETGPLTHTMLFGVDVQRNDADEKYGSGNAPDLSLAAPNYYLPVASFANQRSFDQLQTQTGLYAQDQIRFGRWAFLAGVRQDWAETDVDGKIGLASSSISNSATTGRVGLVYLFDNGLAPYAGYSTSFDPQAGSYYDGTPFQPTTGRQYEVGMKYQPPGSNSFVTLAAFDLTEQNVPTADPDPDHGPYAQVETGEIRSRGIELEGHASLTDDLSLVGAYSYMDPKVTKDTDYQGRQPVQIPRNTASGWADYTLHQGPLSGLGFGAGIRFIGSTYADQDNTLKVPSFTLVDAALRYDLGRLNSSLDGALLSVNVSNLFDRTYVSSCDSAYTCYYGLRRTVYANLKYRF